MLSERRRGCKGKNSQTGTRRGLECSEADFVFNAVQKNRRSKSFFGKGRGETGFCKKRLPRKLIEKNIE